MILNLLFFPAGKCLHILQQRTDQRKLEAQHYLHIYVSIAHLATVFCWWLSWVLWVLMLLGHTMTTPLIRWYMFFCPCTDFSVFQHAALQWTGLYGESSRRFSSLSLKSLRHTVPYISYTHTQSHTCRTKVSKFKTKPHNCCVSFSDQRDNKSGEALEEYGPMEEIRLQTQQLSDLPSGHQSRRRD